MERHGPPVFAQPLAAWERGGLKASLAGAGLAIDDVEDPDLLFWRFEADDVPVGFAGIVVFGQDALLRSLVTLPPVRQRGIGCAMVAKMETEARARGAHAIYLLTSDATSFFARLDYAPCGRDAVPAAIVTSAQFARSGADSATVMMKRV
ncbi:MAG TPA: GNAT family N-acetyltransferase [Xanthobacteraceae bacterium]